MSDQKKPILTIYIAKTSVGVWTGFLENVTPEVMDDLQKSLFDDEEPEKYLADLYLGTSQDLEKALNCGSHPGKYLQENCEEVFLGDYIKVTIDMPINQKAA